MPRQGSVLRICYTRTSKVASPTVNLESLSVIVYYDLIRALLTCYVYCFTPSILKTCFLYLTLSPSICCHSLVLILILISIKTRSDNIFGQKPPHPTTTTPPGTQLCLILLKLSTFQVNHQNKSCLSILEQSKNDVRLSWY